MIRILCLLPAAVVYLLLAPQPALAADSQTPGTLSWITLTDTNGISIWNYELSLDRGGTLHPGRMFWSTLIDIAWGSYRSWVAIALWFLDWVMSLDWLGFVASPFITVGDAMQVVVQKIGVGHSF